MTDRNHPVDAATVLLLRDGADGLEVFLLERHLRSDFFGGAYVFPGGKVDASDRAFPAERWTGADPERLGPRIGATPDLALGLLVAAVRETFEEAGVLLARREDGAPVTRSELAAPSFVEARGRLSARGAPWDWRPWLAEERLVLDLAALHPWSWWITPQGQHRRFDTRFFVAEVPPAQRELGAHDDVEATDSVWTTPAAALLARERREYQVIFPTRRNLQSLQSFDRAADVVEAAASTHDALTAVLPVASVDADGTVLVKVPGEDTPEPVE